MSGEVLLPSNTVRLFADGQRVRDRLWFTRNGRRRLVGGRPLAVLSLAEFRQIQEEYGLPDPR